jgi:hypothetical protein
MNDRIKLALIAAGTVLIAVAALVHFSPYQSCIRGVEGTPVGPEYPGDPKPTAYYTHADASLICRRAGATSIVSQ